MHWLLTSQPEIPLETSSFRTLGQFFVKYSKPSFSITAFRAVDALRKLKHASLSPWQLCWSANAKMVPAEPISMCLHSLSSQISFILSRLSLLENSPWELVGNGLRHRLFNRFPQNETFGVTLRPWVFHPVP